MGSLTPGCLDLNANVPTGGFEDTPEEDTTEKQGYFARYEKNKSMRVHDDVPFVAALPKSYSLARRSLPLPTAPAPAPAAPSPAKKSSPPIAAAERPAQAQAPMFRAGSLEAPGMTHKHPKPTDWEAELRALGGSRKATPPPTKPSAKEQPWSFSRHLDSAVLNEPPLPTDEAEAKKPYTPQFNVAGNTQQYRAAKA